MMSKKVSVGKLYYQFSVEERVPADHLLRRIAAAVDFSFVRRLAAPFYSHTGQPSVDPVVLFKMALLGFVYGITSERRLVEEIKLNLAYLWFIGYDIDEPVPNHSVFTKARRRFGPTIYRAYFKQVVQQCEKAGLVRGDKLYVDSTEVQADASKESMASRALVQQLPDIDQHVKDLWANNPEPPAGEKGDPAESMGEAPKRLALTPSRPEASAASAAEGSAVPPTSASTKPAEQAPAQKPRVSPELPTESVPAERASVPSGPTAEASRDQSSPTTPKLHLATSTDEPNRVGAPLNERQVSRVDPEAEFVQRAGVPGGLYYKVHTGVDRGRERIVTAVEVTGGAVADEHLLERIIKEHQGNLGRPLREVVADTKYGTMSNYKRLEEIGVKASIPIRVSSAENREVRPGQFEYDPKGDVFVCPNGQRLGRRGRASNGSGEPVILYRAKPIQCANCALKSGCCGEAEARSVSHPDDGGLRDRTVAYLATPHARRSIRQRQAWIETMFADGKERRGLRRAHCRGQDAVLIQALMTAMAQNVRQLALRKGKRPDKGVGALRVLSIGHPLTPTPRLSLATVPQHALLEPYLCPN